PSPLTRNAGAGLRRCGPSTRRHRRAVAVDTTNPHMTLTVQEGAELTRRVRDAVSTRIVGQDAAIDDVLATFLARGHALIEGVPGPAKTQAALLEAMAERQVTADGTTRPLEPLFTVLATQNPVEHEGTFPLPEAQLDRFLMKILVGYPPADAEAKMLELHESGFDPEKGGGAPIVERVLSADQVRDCRQLVDQV